MTHSNRQASPLRQLDVIHADSVQLIGLVNHGAHKLNSMPHSSGTSWALVAISGAAALVVGFVLGSRSAAQTGCR